MSPSKLVFVMLLAGVLGACGQSSTGPTAASPTGQPVASPTPSASAASPASVPAPTPAPAPSGQEALGFKVKVTLTDAAKTSFAKSGESVIVSASWFGAPKPGIDKSQIDEIGQVDLGRKDVTLPGEGTATFDGSAVQRDKLGLIADAPQVNVNVYSGRRTSPDNLLACDMYQGSVSFAASKPVQLHCALLTEKYETRAVLPSAAGSG